jgi:glyoxylase-like metal-dependent hydrolase (beta-lactamase superfamily II)
MTHTPGGQSIQFDDATVTRIIEWAGPIKTVAEILPDTPAEDWQANRSLLAPDFWNPDTGAYLCHIQTWVIRVAGRTILVDTGVGNDRERPQIPAFAHLHTDFLEHFVAAGVEPEDVDIVINTHIHYDHVGWNTHLVDGAFVPTFPNATYLVPQPDYDYCRPDNARHMRPPETEDEQQRFEGIRLVFADSITPVEKSGQLQLWQEHHELPGLPISLEPAPGHTPGSSLARLRAGAGALFVGDLLHSPMQVLHPDHRCSFDLDAAQARATRRRILNQAAVDSSFILPAHLPGHSAFTVATGAKDELAVERWARLSRWHTHRALAGMPSRHIFGG